MERASRRRATYEDLLAIPDSRVAEILDGVLIVSPRPAIAHACATTGIAQALQPFCRPAVPGEPGGWWVLFEPELHLADDVLVPDLAGWRRDRLPALRSVPFLTLAPDWVCEVVSPTTARHDRVTKMRIYARAGVSSLWLVDPIARTVEVYRQRDDTWIVVATHGGEAPLRAEPFGLLALDPLAWWIDTPSPELA